MTSFASANQSTIRRLISSFLVLLGGNMGATALTMVAVAINARALDLAEFGTLAVLQTSALLVAGLFTFSTQQAVIKIGIAAREGEHPERFERILGMGFVADFIGALLAGSFALATLAILPSLIGIEAADRSAAYIVALSLFFQGFRTSEAVFRIFDEFRLMAWIQLFSGFVTLCLAAALWLAQAPFVYYAIFVVATISLPSLLQLGISLRLLARNGQRPRFSLAALPRSSRKEFIAYCWTTSATGTADTIRQYGDAPLVGLLVSVEAAGIYNVCRQVAGVLRKASAVYASVLFPQLATYAALGMTAAARTNLRKLIGISLLSSVAAAIAAWVAGAPLLGIVFGPEFRDGSTVLLLLFAAAGLQLISATYSMYVQAFVGPLGVLFAYLVAIVGFLCVAIPAMTTFGLIGAGAAQIAFFGILAAMCRLRLNRSVEWNGSELDESRGSG